MIAESKRIATKLLVLGALVLGTGGFLLETTEAGGTAGETEMRWLLTDEAVARTVAGDCRQNASGTVCREECRVHVATGHEEPTGRFDCFPF
ncbi:MAG: hypothetical protein MI919_11480 [Holophagales bacterium]|nr:hypothetical protein [Holophagales bacterium]